MSISIEEFEKATESLKIANHLLKQSFIKEPQNTELHKALRDSCIQRFEFCVELAWKISIRILGLQTKAPNPAIRDMAQNNLISDPQLWFDFLNARNKTSHTYNEDVAKIVHLEVERIIPELEKLLENLRKHK